MRQAHLLGCDHHEVGSLASIAEAEAAITLSRGGALKTYSHTEPNEDAALFALGQGGSLIAVADGHSGASGSEAMAAHLLESCAESWTRAGKPEFQESSWEEVALETVYACGRAVLARSAEIGVPPAPSTLSIALARPDEDLLFWLSAGDSHVFLTDASQTRDVGWSSLGHKRTYFVGYEAATREGIQNTFAWGSLPLSSLSAVTLATDGLSEPGIGFPDPEAQVHETASQTASLEASIRPLEMAKHLSFATLEIQRAQRAGDNLACALLDLRTPPAPRYDGSAL